MPAWVDLSEHKAALNVYQSQEDKMLLLRALTPDSSIPEAVTQIGFVKQDDFYVRKDLRFTLKEIQRYFPLAVPRDLAGTEIFYVPSVAVDEVLEDDSATQAKQPWQLKASEWASLPQSSRRKRFASHLEMVKVAIADGHQVPFEVIAEYPELLEAPDSDQAGGLAQGMALVASIAKDLGGSLTAWEKAGPGVIGQWRYATLSVSGADIRIGVSEGGVVQINRDPFTPVDRILNVTRDAVMTSINAAVQKHRQGSSMRRPQAGKGWRAIGKNREGLPIEEDALGVRSLIKNGARMTETVAMTPYGPRPMLDQRELDYFTDAELQERAEKDGAQERAVEKELAAAGAVSPRVGDALHGAIVHAVVDDVPVNLYRKKLSRYDHRKELAGKTCTWARAYLSGDWISLGEPWPHSRPSAAELRTAIRHARENVELFDGDAMLMQLNIDVSDPEAFPINVFRLAKVDSDSFELRFKDTALPFSIVIDYQSPGVYMASDRGGGVTGPRTTLCNAVAWAARELLSSKAYYDRTLTEQNKDLPKYEVNLASFRQVFGEVRDSASTLQQLRKQFPKLSGQDTVDMTSNRNNHIDIPDNLALAWADSSTLRLSLLANHHFEVELRAADPAHSQTKRNYWTAEGALGKAIDALHVEAAWAQVKASRADGGAGLDELAHRYAQFMHLQDPERHAGVVSKMHREFALAVTDKRHDFLLGWLARPKGQNDLSKKFFAEATGVKLPRTAKDITIAIYAWAGYSAEQAQEMETAKRTRREAAYQEQGAKRHIEYCINAMESTRVLHNGQEKTARQFLDEIVAQGYDSLETKRVGAVDRYRLVNRERGSMYPLRGQMVDYVRHALSKRQELASTPEEECAPALKR